MKLSQSMFFLVAAALALAVGAVYAADEVGKDKNDPGFHALDKNGDGSISKTEAAANPALAKNFAEADKNHDGKLSRAEYLWAMTKQDAATAAKKTENAVSGGTSNK